MYCKGIIFGTSISVVSASKLSDLRTKVLRLGAAWWSVLSQIRDIVCTNRDIHDTNEVGVQVRP
jgi:hypothetical protein